MSTLLEEGYEALLDDVIRVGAVRTLYQPIVALDTFEVVGYEALARGPEGSRLEQPHLLFETARACGRLDDLDWLCRTTALTGALEAGLKRGTTLFLNVEPAALASPLPPSYWRVWERSRQELSVLFEVTERALTATPGSLLRRCDEIRSLGWGIALDDVGVDPNSLAMLPLLRPDVIKLDRLLMKDDAAGIRSRVVHAVSAEQERRGTAVVAEGIENEEQVEMALAMGATLGQGWFFGRPDGLPSSPTQPESPISVRRTRPTGDATTTPFTLLQEKRPTQIGTKRMLQAMSRNLEDQMTTLGDGPVLLACFQDASYFGTNTATRYAHYANNASFVAALGIGMDEHPAPQVHGADLDPNDPLVSEWDVVVLSPHFAGALAARDLGDLGKDGERRFESVWTYDRDLVVQLATNLMTRIVPASVDR